MKSFLTTAFVFLFALIAFADPEDNPDAKEYSINIKFYHIDVEFDLDNPFIKGSVYVEFVALQPDLKAFSLDVGEGLKVSKIDGASEFEQRGEEVFISLEGRPLKKEERSKITLYYEGTPTNVNLEVEGEKVTKGLLYQKRGEGEYENTLIVTATYPQMGYKWFPCRRGLGDKADSLYVDVTIKNRKGFAKIGDKKQAIPYTAVSNGVLAGIEKMEEEGKRKYKWRHIHRIAPHHVVVAISNFAKIDNEYSGKDGKYPLSFYTLPENIEQSKPTIARSREIMACLTRTFGPYPFRNEGFSVIEVGLPLGLDGMPMQGSVLVEDLKSFHMYQVVHQAANMWFGNHISPEQWQDAWITEALATYAEAMWQEYKRGLNIYQVILDEKEYYKGGKLYLDNIEDYSKERLSKKGMYVIHMLRGIMGDVYFFEALKGITGLKRSRSTYISTEKFADICEYYASENVPVEYDYFFEQWIRGEYYPVYEIEYETQRKGEVALTIRQKEWETKPSFFKMKAKVKVYFDDGTDETVEIESEAVKEKVYNLNFDKEVVDLDFDPSNWIFKDLHYVRKKDNEKFAITDIKIETSEGRRKLDISFDVAKKQDIKIELIRKADNIQLMEDKVVHTEELSKVNEPQNLPIKIPVGPKDRDVFEIRITGKTDVIKKPLRIIPLEKRF